VYVSWSIVAGQSHGQWGPEFPGMLQFSLRPGILNYCPAGSAAEYFAVNLVAASHFFPFSIVLNFIYVYGGGYIVVT
jgi:hypothetical protein